MHATIQAKQPTAVHNNQRNYKYSIYPVNATIGPCKSHIPQTTDAAMRCYQVRVLLMMARHLLVPDKAPRSDGKLGIGPNNSNNNKHLRCGNRKGLLGRNDQTHQKLQGGWAVICLILKGGWQAGAQLTSPIVKKQCSTFTAALLECGTRPPLSPCRCKLLLVTVKGDFWKPLEPRVGSGFLSFL